MQNYSGEKILSRFLAVFFIEIYGRNPYNLMIDNKLRYADFST